MNRSSITSWGPSGWTYLHAASYAYPLTPSDIERENMFYFLHYFARVIPCQRCRRDFRRILEEKLHERINSPVFDTRNNLVQFLVDAHNSVNKRLGKRMYSYSEVDRLYTERSDWQLSKVACLIVIIVSVVYIGHKRTVSKGSQ